MESHTTYAPRNGDRAPVFEAFTTMGNIKLEDYKGKWLILFSHPADFTPVCTTEFIALARLYPEFQKRGAELLGLSIDSNSSHIAWLRNIEEKAEIRVPFPVISDSNKEVAILYGMVMPGESQTETVRSVFFIDPEQIIRCMLYYPVPVGRNVDEMLRVLDALQTVDEYKVATPANWKPGEPVVVPPPQTQEAAEERMKQGYDCMDWYLCRKKLDTKPPS